MEKSVKRNKTQKIKKVEGKKRKRLEGVVVSNKMEKTVVVKVTSKRPYPLYRKVVKHSKKYKVHTDEKLEAGDKVKIEQCRPISRGKKWKVIEVL